MTATKNRRLAFLGKFDLSTWLFVCTLIVYLVTRLIGLDRFPIYFFTDEANQTQSIANLVDNNYRLDDVLLPTYFPNGLYYNLGLSVYMQWLPFMLFGKSAVVTRMTSVLITLLAAISVGLILRDIFKLRHWWVGTLLLSITPAWFLHSRTAFETVEFVSFYSGAICAYLYYRYRSPHYLYVALLLTACAFYTYSPAQFIVPITILALALSDWRYHVENRHTVLRGIGLMFLLGLPYLRFIFYNPHIPFMHLNTLGSYWMENTPFFEKLRHYLSEYAVGLSPWYWYTPNIRDLSRHLMKDYGHILLFTLPFAVIGLLSLLRDLRFSANRAVLIVMLVSPAAAALVGINVTRSLLFVIVASILSAIGFEKIMVWIQKIRFDPKVIAIFVFVLLSFVNIWMLNDALRNGPTWYSNYGFDGMQYGAFQIFDAVEQYKQEHPDTGIVVTQYWANGPDVLAYFFLGDPLPIQIGSVRDLIHQKIPFDDSILFVTTPQEYQEALDSQKFTGLRVEKTIPYPDGSPGFYFIHLRYVDDVDEIFAAEAAARRVLQETDLIIAGEKVKVRYSKQDSDRQEESIAHLFDGDPLTFAKTAEANPFVVELTYPAAHTFNGVSIVIGSARVVITVTGYAHEGAEPVVYTFKGQGSMGAPELSFDFPEPLSAQTVRIELLDINNKEPTFVHMWEITFR